MTVNLKEDTERLVALGVEPKFDRSMSMLENFALGFTYLSPVVGAYTLFDSSLATGGPPMIWTYLIAGVGQLLVALIFGELVSQYPLAGGLYPWARRLIGRRWGWMVGWVYAWALFATIAAVATGAAPFLSILLGTDDGPGLAVLIALALLLAATVCNLAGTRFLARVAMFGFICELVGALFVGGYLLLFQRVQSPEILFDPMTAAAGGSYLPAFLAASLLGLFSCYGFEACADVAEEVKDPERTIPRAMRMTIYVGIGASVFACLALLLAVPDIPAVISGESPRPLTDVLVAAFGTSGTRAIAVVIVISFMSCVLSLQAAVSRLIFAFARDRMIFSADLFARLSPDTHVPVAALALAGAVPAAIVLLGAVMADALTTIVTFAVAGVYLAFHMVVIAALVARFRGWRPTGAFTLGGWGWLVNVAAFLYGFGALVNMMWPRAPDSPWYIDHAMILGVTAVLASGVLYLFIGRPEKRSEALHGDALAEVNRL
ncbi:MAG: amino acid permease [Sphingopyxis sp.]|nr:amino acid permease [Sphingopyxis sp.]